MLDVLFLYLLVLVIVIFAPNYGDTDKTSEVIKAKINRWHQRIGLNRPKWMAITVWILQAVFWFITGSWWILFKFR